MAETKLKPQAIDLIEIGTCTVTQTSSAPNTTWTDVTNGSITVSCKSGDQLMIIAQVTSQNSSASGRADVKVLRDGTTDVCQLVNNTGSASKTMTNLLFNVFTATTTSHTFKLQYSDQLASGGTVTVFASPYTFFKVINLGQ